MTTTVANVKVQYIRKHGYNNLEEWCADCNNVYIGRAGIVFIRKERYPKCPSKWANPFKVGKDGTLEEVIDKYYNHVMQLLKDPAMENELRSMVGKNLGCWCVDANGGKTFATEPLVCHGQILLRIMQERFTPSSLA